MRVFVIGATGLVGQNVVERGTDRGHTVVGTYHSNDETGDIHLDKTDEAETIETIAEHDPELVVDTAAYHAVDECETDRERAWEVNVTGTRNAAFAADAVDAHYVYLSTDYVFPGDPANAPYVESDPVSPESYYARVKFAAEQAARIPDKWTVLRPSVIYGHASDNFATWALGELADGNDIGIVDDQTSRPTYAPDLATACLGVGSAGVTGLYHATGPESLSRYEFTRTLANAYGYDESLIEPIPTGELGQEAPRPEDSSLDSSRLYDALGVEFRPPREAAQEMAQEMNR